MKGIVYSTTPTQSISAGKGGGNEKILEIWIENLKICINEKKGAFYQETPRRAFNHFGTFELPDPFCQIIRNYVKLKEDFELSNKKVFEALREKLIINKSMHNKIIRHE